MKKMLTMIGVLAVASTPTIGLKNIVINKTQNLQNILTKSSYTAVTNSIELLDHTDYKLSFVVRLSNSDYNGFSGFLDQISFKLSDFDYHAWPIYLLQWLDDDDFGHPMPGLNSHTKHGFFHYPFVFSQRFETNMGHFGSWLDDKSSTAFKMASSYGLWGTFGQTVDNQWNTDRAHSVPLLGIQFTLGFMYDTIKTSYSSTTPIFRIITS